MARAPGPSARLKLTLSYAGFLVVAGLLLITATWAFLLRDVPVGIFVPRLDNFAKVFVPGNRGPVIFGPAAVTVLAFLLVLGLGGGWLLAGRMLAPLTRITEATRVAARGSLSHRIALTGRQDEFRELADGFDAMLAQLEAQIDRQRRFAANASHELRTPLAITQTLLDVARDDPRRDHDALDERLRAVNTRAIRLTEALLLLSRADRGTFTPETVDLSLVADEAAEELLPLAEERGVTVETTGDVTLAVGSHALLLQTATNLLHNAIVHNLRGGGTVHLDTATDAGSAVLVVENTGAELSPALVSTLTEPFRRGTERVGGDDPGVGLGLAIVTSVVDAHEGTLTLAPVPTGGLRVTVRLPGAGR